MTEERDLETLKAAYPITHCPDCGYSRTGLDAAHTCPECGWTPDDKTIVVYTNSPSKTTDFDWRNVLSFLPLAFLFLSSFFEGLLPKGISRTFLVISAAIVVAIVLTFLRRKTPEQVGSFQIRLGRTGYSVRVGYGEAKLKPWPRRTVVRSARTLTGRRQLRLGTRIPFTPMLTGYYIVIDAVAAEPLYALERQLRRWAERE